MNSVNNTDCVVSIPKERLAKLEPAVYKGEIRVIDNESDVPEAVRILRQATLLGFDTETRPSFKKGLLHNVSLIQLSTCSICFLFRINKTGFHQDIKDLLEDGEIKKIGLSIHDDFHNLNKLSSLSPDGFIDLQQYVKDFRIVDNSLSRIYGIIFGKRISKGQRLSNWEADSLSTAQQHYAALDAKACIDIFEYLESGKFDPSASEYLTFPSPQNTEEP